MPVAFFWETIYIEVHRRYTIEVHSKFSEAPHLTLRSSIPHPKTDFNEYQNTSRYQVDE